MFQYACGRALSLRTGATLCFDLSGYRSYRLHSFGLSEFCGAIVEAPWHLRTGTRLWSVLRRLGLAPEDHFRARGITWIHEAGDLRFEPQRLAVGGNLYLDGYWQSERYFRDYEQTIRADFSLTARLAERLEERRVALGISSGLTVSLHVRRGDYVQDPVANAVHGVLGAEYYGKAIGYLAHSLSQRAFRVLVFSDDIAWARSHLAFPNETVFVEPDTRYPQVDIHLMASCDHHVIANSSFSWWGAWLNAAPDKTVIAPAKWFNTSQYYSGDICPSSWVRL